MIDHLAGRQKNPWSIEYSRLNSLIDAAASITNVMPSKRRCAIIAIPGSSQWSASACWKCKRNETP